MFSPEISFPFIMIGHSLCFTCAMCTEFYESLILNNMYYYLLEANEKHFGTWHAICTKNDHCFGNMIQPDAYSHKFVVHRFT